jgi:ribosomal protein L11 methyltransferase
VAHALERHRARFVGERVLDVGCGSGILALVALLLGAASARAVDNDPEVIEVARDNAERNGLAERVVIDTLPVERIDERFVVVVANIEAGTLCRLAPALARRLRDGGLLVLSGVLASQRDEVVKVFGSRPGNVELVHLGSVERREPESGSDDAWVAISFERAG